MIRNIFRAACLGLSMLAAAGMSAQSAYDLIKEDLNKSGGVYYAYPTTSTRPTPPPKGYKPFYVSHYGRHGSRYLISDNDYEWIADLLHQGAEADALTPLGLDVMARVDTLMLETKGRGGDLSPLGVRQHRSIASRMYADYPEVFAGEAEVDAKSTVVIRCVLSMDAFCERLKELNPKLKTTRDASGRHMHYMNYHSPESNEFTGKNGYWHEEYRKFENAHTNPDRLMASLFTDKKFIDRYVNPNAFMWGLYWLASDQQDVETPGTFYDLFTADELYDLWQCFNYRFYVCDSNYKGNGGLVLANAKPLLGNILTSADAAIAKDEPSSTLRFGHDGNLIPLAGILGIEGCDVSVENPEDFQAAFNDFKISPMAGNIQLIFFRKSPKAKEDSEILVKVLHNEKEVRIPVDTDMWPFYRWSDVKAYYQDVIQRGGPTRLN